MLRQDGDGFKLNGEVLAQHDVGQIVAEAHEVR